MLLLYTGTFLLAVFGLIVRFGGHVTEWIDILHCGNIPELVSESVLDIGFLTAHIVLDVGCGQLTVEVGRGLHLARLNLLDRCEHIHAKIQECHHRNVCQCGNDILGLFKIYIYLHDSIFYLCNLFCRALSTCSTAVP